MREKIEKLLETYWDEGIKLLPNLLVAILFFLFAFFVARFISRTLKHRVRQYSSAPMAILLANAVRGFFLAIGISIALNIAGWSSVANSILAGAGISGVVVGFAFKEIAENFLAGILLAFNTPFKLGDLVETGTLRGTVTAMDLYHTHIKSQEGNDVYVPNSQILKNHLTNFSSDSLHRHEIVLHIQNSKQLELAEKLILEILLNEPFILQEDKMPVYSIDEIWDNIVKIKILIWTDVLKFPEATLVKIKNNILPHIQQVLIQNGMSFAPKLQN